MVVGVERVALLDRGDPLQAALHELVVDRLLDQRPRRAGADLALVEREQHEALDRLVEERRRPRPSRRRRRCSGDLPPSSSVTGIRFCAAYCMISRPVSVSPVKAILAMRGLDASGLPASPPEPLTMLSTPGGQQVADQLGQHQDRPRRRLSRLEHHAVAGGERRRELPRRHQEREVPRDDLADDAERLVEVVGDGVVVDLGDACLPARASRRRSSGSGRPPAGCRRPASRGPACRCPSSRRRRASRGSPRSRRRSCSGPLARSAGDVSPQASLAACAASSASSMSSAVERATSQNGLAVDRA